MSKIDWIAKRLWGSLPDKLRSRLRTTPLFIRLRNCISRLRYRGASHDEVFDEEYFQFVDKTTLESAAVMADSIISAYRPQSVWDIGCGTGALLECLRRRAVDGHGLELAEAALTFCRSRNLDVRKFNIIEDTLAETSRGDVAVSMEVGAQLPPSGADRYVSLLCEIAPVIVFSAEAPGGGDRLVLNEQPHEYWIEKFLKQGYILNERRTNEWRTAWKAAKVAPWFCRNVLLFEKIGADLKVSVA